MGPNKNYHEIDKLPKGEPSKIEKALQGTTEDWEIANRIAKELHDSDALYQLTRRQRRKEKKRINDWNESFSFICEQYVSEVLNKGFQFDSDEGTVIFERFDTKWRKYIRLELPKYNYPNFRKPSTREKIFSKFNTFVSNFMQETINPAAKDVKEIEVKGEKQVEYPNVEIHGKLYGLPDAIELLHSHGFKTAAKTKKGIQRYINNLDEDIQRDISFE